MKIKRNTILSGVSIDSIGHGGLWIATHESWKKILVKHGLPGSIVDVKVIKNKKDYIQWTISRVVEPPTHRIDGEVKCPHYAFPYHTSQAIPIHKQWCGWCKRQIVPYTKQCEIKDAIVHDALKTITTRYSFDRYPLLASPQVYQYRNKIEFSFGKFLVRNKWDTINSDTPYDQFSTAEHRQMWFHKQWEFSKVVDVDQCFLVSEKVHSIYSRIKSDLQNSWIPVYDAKTHVWCLRHLVVREWVRTGHCMINLALSDIWFQDHPKHQKVLDVLIHTRSQELTEVTTMVITINNWLADIVHGKDSITQICRWEGVIYEWLQFEDIQLLKFQVSPFSFFQTNTVWAEVLFSAARELLWKKITGNVIDLYCGSGTIGLSFLAQWIGKNLYGIEIVESAVKDAEYNAKINWLSDRSTFWAWKAEKLLLEWTLWEEVFGENDLVIIDPPRSWLHPKVIDFLRRVKKEYGCMLLYISCNPVTLWRDLELLLAWGVYTLEKVQPVDMFPQTHHIEVVGVMR